MSDFTKGASPMRTFLMRVFPTRALSLRALSLAALTVAGAVALACGDSGTSGPEPDNDPVPGWAKVRYSTANADDGGIMFSLSGGQIDSIRSSFSNFYTASTGPNFVRVIVAGNLAPGGVVAEVLVPDLGSLAGYLATVEQVASRDTYEQRQPSAVSLAVER